MGKRDNPDDARNWSIGDMNRNQEELDDVHIRAYDPSKDEILDTVFISDAEGGEDRARRAVNATDAQARRRGKNISAQTKRVRGGWQVITYKPKGKK
jgi:hypothetical protein